MKSLRALEERTVGSIVSALRTDLKVGLNMATIASQARDEEKRQRNQKNARLAYDTVRQKAQSVPLSATDETEINSQLTKLRTALEALGEMFQDR